MFHMIPKCSKAYVDLNIDRRWEVCKNGWKVRNVLPPTGTQRSLYDVIDSTNDEHETETRTIMVS